MSPEKVKKLLDIAWATSALSKGRHTRVGALILGPDGEGGPWGYNGFPRGANEDVPARHVKPEKFHWTEHAERNAIFNAARQGYQTRGCTMVVTHFPCMDCARAIVQCGLALVVCPTPNPDYEQKWGESIRRSMELFAECGVEVKIV